MKYDWWNVLPFRTIQCARVHPYVDLQSYNIIEYLLHTRIINRKRPTNQVDHLLRTKRAKI